MTKRKREKERGTDEMETQTGGKKGKPEMSQSRETVETG